MNDKFDGKFNNKIIKTKMMKIHLGIFRKINQKSKFHKMV